HLGLATLALDRDDQAACRKHLAYCLNNPHAQKNGHKLLARIYEREENVLAAALESNQVDRMPDDAQCPDPPLTTPDFLRADAPPAITSRAVRLWNAGHQGEALELLHVGSMDYPERDDIWLKLGQFLTASRQFQEAEKALGKAASLAPNTAETHYALGVALAGQNKHSDAIVSFRKAIDIHPLYPDAHFFLGES